MYPIPVRSDYQPSSTQPHDDSVVEIGWSEGAFGEGRPFRAEAWAEDGITMLTFFFSTDDLKDSTSDQLAELLVQEGLLRFRSAKRFVGDRPLLDASGNEMWSVNIVVGDENELYAEDSLALRPYTVLDADAEDTGPGT
jgi:hypothetical protein